MQVLREPRQHPKSTDADAITLLEQDLLIHLTRDPINPELVIRCCNQLINLEPDHFLARFNRGSMKAGLGDHAGALQDLLVAIRVAPDDNDAWLLVSASAVALGRSDLAISAAVRGVSLDADAVLAYMSTYPEVRAGLARMLEDPEIGTGEDVNPLRALLMAEVDPALHYGRERDFDELYAKPRSAHFDRFPAFPILSPPVASSIAERFVNSDSLEALSAGYLLARMHANHVMHGDFRPENLFFDLSSGAAGPYEIAVGWIRDFDVRHAAADFQTVSGMQSRGFFDALAIGYGKAFAVRGRSADVWPEEVFALVGVEPSYGVRIDPRPAWSDELVGCLDFHVTDVTEAAEASASVTRGEEDRLRGLLAFDSRHSAAFAVALAFLNYDVTPVWRVVTGREDEPAGFSQLVGEIVTEAQTENSATLGGDPHYALAQWLIRYVAQPPRQDVHLSGPRRGSVQGGVASALHAIELLKSADSQGTVRSSALLDDVLTVVDTVALAWDRHGSRRWSSQAAAQLSQILLRAWHWDPGIDESRELGMAARHSALTWLKSPKLRDGFGTDDASPYVLARISALTTLFTRTIPPRTTSGPVPYPGVQWSLAWRGLALTHGIIPPRITRLEDYDEGQLMVTRGLLFHRHELLRQYSMALMTALGAQLMVEGRLLATQFSHLNDEFQALSALVHEEAIDDMLRSADPRLSQYSNNFLSKRREFLFDRLLPNLIGE